MSLLSLLMKDIRAKYGSDLATPVEIQLKGRRKVCKYVGGGVSSNVVGITLALVEIAG